MYDRYLTHVLKNNLRYLKIIKSSGAHVRFLCALFFLNMVDKHEITRSVHSATDIYFMTAVNLRFQCETLGINLIAQIKDYFCYYF